MNSMLTINIHLQDQSKKIDVSSLDTLNIIQHKLNLTYNHFIIFNNQILFQKFSFKFFNIKDNDHLFLLPINLLNNFKKNLSSNQTLKLQLLKLTKNNNKKISEEKAKYLDLRIMRFEEKSYYIRKAETFLKSIEDNNNEINLQKSILPQQLDAPSTKNLPIFWEKAETSK